MDENLSRVLAELFAKPNGGEELSSKIQRLRGEIRKVVEGGDTIFGKFRELVESFREIIPDEKQRYNAAIKALSTTAKLSRQEIIKAVNEQIEELKILEKGLLPALPGWRDELKAMETKAQEKRAEITKLREIIGRLENEEKGFLSSIEERKKEMENVEKAVGELFTVIGAEITHIRLKVEEFGAESAAPQPIPSQPTPPKNVVTSEMLIPPKEPPKEAAPLPAADAAKGDAADGEQEIVEEEIDLTVPSAPLDPEWQKKCPMCGGRMDFHIQEKMWICYSCAYEESNKDGVQGKSDEANAPKPAPMSDPFPDLSRPSVAVSLADMTDDEDQETKKGSSSVSFNSQASNKKKTCPVCRKKMSWYYKTKTWRCPFCQYERSI